MVRRVPSKIFRSRIMACQPTARRARMKADHAEPAIDPDLRRRHHKSAGGELRRQERVDQHRSAIRMKCKIERKDERTKPKPSLHEIDRRDDERGDHHDPEPPSGARDDEESAHRYTMPLARFPRAIGCSPYRALEVHAATLPAMKPICHILVGASAASLLACASTTYNTPNTAANAFSDGRA